MKVLCMIAILLGYLAHLAHGQVDNYYYYHGQKKEIKINPTMFYLAMEDSISKRPLYQDQEIDVQVVDSGFSDYDGISSYWEIIKVSGKTGITDQAQSNAKVRSFAEQFPAVFVGPVIGEEYPVAVSQFFYVKLKSRGDWGKLVELAKDNGAEVLAEVPYTDLWYTLVCNSTTNSINASNAIFSSGLPEEVSPDFMFNFEHTEVADVDWEEVEHLYQACISDPLFPQQWGLQQANGIDIKACNAWTITVGNSGVVMGIFDTGIANQTEFSATLSPLSYNAQTGTSPAPSTPASNHGTHVAGIAGANQNNFQISGVAPSATLRNVYHPLSVNPNVSAQLASGINWAWQNGVHVLNNSWGDQGGAAYNDLQSAVLESAINSAMANGRGGLGTIVVFASGNFAPVMDYPAYYSPNILAVGSIQSSGTRSSFSGYGTQLDVVAPGSNILSTIPGNGTAYLSGTSMAAPHATGLAALILSKNPTLTRAQVINLIESTCQKVGGYSYTTTSGRPNGTWNNQMGYGLINAHAALVATPNPPSCSTSTPPQNITGVNYTSSTTLNGCNFVFTNVNVQGTALLTVNADGYTQLNGTFSVVAGASLLIQ